MSRCLFCDIVAGRIPARQVHADSECLAFEDINPQAPTHILIIPRRHIASLVDLTEADISVMGHLDLIAARLAAQRDLDRTGYRCVLNCGPDGGQTVPHVHLHLLGGRPLSWPPG